jgi:predicted acyl esterase
VEGPWNHGGWRSKGRSLAQVDFGSDTGTYFREHIEAPWFAYYLKDKGNLKQAEATIFQSGTNKWMTYDAWPPRRKVRKADLFLQAGGQLSFEKSSAAKQAEEFDGYTSDPASAIASWSKSRAPGFLCTIATRRSLSLTFFWPTRAIFSPHLNASIVRRSIPRA